MKIKITKNGSKEVNKFYAKEWISQDILHYGHEVSWDSWIPKHFIIEVHDEKNIVGALTFTINQDVTLIEMLITAQNKRRIGIGTMLMDRMEEISKKNTVHKIYLQTGADWESVKFYESLGYKKTGDLPDHYLHKDYIEMTKFI